MPKHPLAFLSYAHQDDEFDGGRLRRFAERLSGEVQLHSGEKFPIFVDRNDVKWGQEWQERIRESLSETTFLIPVLTPGYFKSSWCREEFLLFLEREKKLNRRDLILSVHYVRCPMLEDPSTQDQLVKVVRARQYKDCRRLRRVAWTEPEIVDLFEDMAVAVVAALERTPSTPPIMAHRANDVPLLVPERPLSENGTPNIGTAAAHSESLPDQLREPVVTPVSGDSENAGVVGETVNTSLFPHQSLREPQGPIFERQVEAADQRSKAPLLKVAAEAQPDVERVVEFVIPSTVETSQPPAQRRLAEYLPEDYELVASDAAEEEQIDSEDGLTEAVRNYGSGNYQAAHEIFCGAAAAGNVVAMYNLGMMHELGLGVAHDLAQARKWYIRAARKRQCDAMNSLGLLYEMGEGVIPPSVEKARVWFRLAVTYQSAEAGENLKRFEN